LLETGLLYEDKATDGVLFQLLWLRDMGFIKFACAKLVCSLATDPEAYLEIAI